jgi:hypothetical protein
MTKLESRMTNGITNALLRTLVHSYLLLLDAFPKATTAKILVVASLVAVQSLLAQEGYKLSDLKTVDGHAYRRVTVTEKSSDGITIRHKSGVARLAWSEAPAQTQRLLGYDAAAEAAAQQKAAAATAKLEEKVKRAAARLSPQEGKSLLSKFVVYPSNNKAWRLTFSDPWTVSISYTYTNASDVVSDWRHRADARRPAKRCVSS